MNRLGGEHRSGVSPVLLSQIEAIAFPIAVIVAALVAYGVYFNFVINSTPPFPVLGAGALAGLIVSFVATRTDLHAQAAIVAGKLHARLIVTTVSLSFLFLLCLFYLLKISDLISRGWLATWYVLAIVFLLVARLVIVLWARKLSAEGRLLQRIAVYGNVRLCERIVDTIFGNDGNLILTGVYSDDKAPRVSRVPVAGDMKALIASAQKGACDRVIVALPWEDHAQIRAAIDGLDVLPIDVQLSPGAMTLPCEVKGWQTASGLTLLDVQHCPLTARGALVKMAMDYTIGALALVLFAPIMALIAIAIKLDSRGPVFFVQSRHGYNHRIVRVLKFRTMTVAEDGAVVRQAVRGDTRVTRVGRFLRRTSLDELPQLINVMRGELSLVGPRPHAVSHNEAYSQILDRYPNRHKVKPGITGWAQINGCRGETPNPESMRKRLELDLYYIQNWSPWLDAKILAKTPIVSIFDAKAY